MNVIHKIEPRPFNIFSLSLTFVLLLYIIIFFFFFFLLKNAMSTIFSQQILSNKLLLIVTNWYKSNLSYEFKLEQITTFHLEFVVKIL